MKRPIKDHYDVLIAGGGTAGITVAAQLRRKQKSLDMAILEPSSKHYYQPLWTLVGAGVFRKELSQRQEAAFIPRCWRRSVSPDRLRSSRESAAS